MKNKYIYNAKIILPNRIIDGTIKIRNGGIEAVEEGKTSITGLKPCETIDACGMYVLPGFVDIINNTIEKEIQPVPDMFLPFDSAYYESEKKLSTSGITTIFHTISITKDLKEEDRIKKLELIEDMKERRYKRSMLHHKVHLKYEVSRDEVYNKVMEFIDSKNIDFLTLIVDSPKNEENLDYGDNFSYAEKRRFIKRDAINRELLQHVIGHAHKKGIKIAAGKNCTVKKLNCLIEAGIGMIEVPGSKITVDYAFENGLFTSASAAEIVAGKSYLNEMDNNAIIKNGNMILISSDSHISSLLASVFKIGVKIDDLPFAVRMVTLNPAKAAGIDKYHGSIKIGKAADLNFVEMYYGYPIVRETYLKGRRVFSNSYYE